MLNFQTELQNVSRIQNVRYFATKSINFQKLYSESMNYIKRIIGQLLELTEFPFSSYGGVLIGDDSL